MRTAVVLAAVTVLVALCAADSRAPQHSFYQPFITGRGGIRYWQYGGAAVVGDESVRLTPNVGSKSGRIWNTVAMAHPDWEAEVEFKIGGGGRLGADGLAVWYAEEPNSDGPVFGSKDSWRGLAVVVDTFDNDGRRDNPAVWALINDGTKTYSPDTDGEAMRVGNGCISLSVRSAQQTSRLRVRYEGGKLTVSVDPQSEGNWQVCVDAVPVTLPSFYHFGVTAATGGLSDNHEVMSFVTYNLDPPEGATREPQTPPPPPAAEPQKEQAPADPQQAQQTQQEQQAQQAQQQPPQEQQKPEDPAVDDLLKRVERLRAMREAAQPTPVQTPPPATPAPVAPQTDTPPPPPPPQQQQSVPTQQQQPPPPPPQQVAVPTSQYTAPPPPPPQQQQYVPPPVAPGQQTSPEVLAELAQLRKTVADFVAETRASLKFAEEQRAVLSDAMAQLLRATSQARAAPPPPQANVEDAVRKAVQETAGMHQSALTEIKTALQRDVVSRVQETGRAADQTTGVLRGQVDSLQREISKLTEKVEATADRTVVQIEKRTSVGFWMLILAFQILFAGAFVVWRRMRDDVNKKLM